eukprot:Skav222183  [mRNA]  locus=scaffold3784:84880:85690:- [translate_table: standard]
MWFWQIWQEPQGSHSTWNIVVCSEAPQMSGSKIDDHMSSVELNRSALRWALKFLRSNGCFASRRNCSYEPR